MESASSPEEPGSGRAESAPGEGIAVLDEATCWQLLAGEEVGRLAVAVAHQPDIYPVNFAVVDSTIVFRTAEGTKLLALVIGPEVAFEVDGFDAEAGTAWSVVVKGHAEEVALYDELDDAAFPVFPWSATPKGHVVRVIAEEVSGRRFHVVQRRPRAGA